MPHRLVRPARLVPLMLGVLVAVLLPAAPALGNADYRSVFRGITPPLPGLTVRVLGNDADYQVTSHSDQVVVIYGYEGEPYLRILPDGTTQQNENSPALYLNTSRVATAPVPAHAHVGAPVVWKTIDKTGRVTWHDHRIHYAGNGTPPQVQDPDKKTKIFDYRIPISEGSRKAHINGTLYWVGNPGGGFSVGAALVLAVILVGGAILVVVVRRRRGDTPDDDGDDAPQREAW